MYRGCKDATSCGTARRYGYGVCQADAQCQIKRLELRDPLCHNSLWLLEVTEPSETGVVCHHHEVAASQVVLKELTAVTTASSSLLVVQ